MGGGGLGGSQPPWGPWNRWWGDTVRLAWVLDTCPGGAEWLRRAGSTRGWHLGNCEMAHSFLFWTVAPGTTQLTLSFGEWEVTTLILSCPSPPGSCAILIINNFPHARVWPMKGRRPTRSPWEWFSVICTHCVQKQIWSLANFWERTEARNIIAIVSQGHWGSGVAGISQASEDRGPSLVTRLVKNLPTV